MPTEIKLGTAGAAVESLHRVLAALGLNVSADEQQQQRFGASTQNALKTLQMQHGLPATGRPTAANGLEALGLVLRVPPDVIVSEVDLPTMDRWRLLRLIRERPSISHSA